MNFCMKCGARLQEGDAFCPMCGSRVEELPPQVPVQPIQQPQQPTQPQQPIQSQQPTQPQASYQREIPKAIPVSPEEEYEMVEPVQQSPYARPAASANYAQSRPSAPATYGRQQPANYGYGQQQANSGYGQQRGYYGQNRPVAANSYGRQQPANYGRPGPKRVKNQGLLKFLSLIFALGLLAAAIGWGCGMYLERTYNATAEANPSNQQTLEIFRAVVREDPKGYRNAVKESYHARNDYSNDKELNDTLYDGIYKTWMESLNEIIQKEVGYRWYIARIGAYGNTLLLIGGIAAGASLLLWLILGGTRAGISQTTLMPLLVMVVIWIVCILLAVFVISPVNLAEEMKAVDVPQLNI